MTSRRHPRLLPSPVLAVATVGACACTLLVLVELGTMWREVREWEQRVVDLEDSARVRRVAAVARPAAAVFGGSSRGSALLRLPPAGHAAPPPPPRATAPLLPRATASPPPRAAAPPLPPPPLAAAPTELPAVCGAAWASQYAATHASLIKAGGPFLAVDCRTSSAASPCNGLGDRTRGVAFLLALAVLSKRALLIDWGYPHPLTDNLQPGAIDWMHRPADYAARLKPLLWHKPGAGDWIDDAVIARDLPDAASRAIPIIKTNSDSLRRLWKSARWAAALQSTGLSAMDVDYRFGCAWHFLFVPSPGLAAVLERYGGALRRGAGPLPVQGDLPAMRAPPAEPSSPTAARAIIGMHFRAGDGFQGTTKPIAGNGHLWGGGIDGTIRDYVACGRAIEARFKLGKAVWLVAADNADFKRKLREAAPDRVAMVELREAEHGHLDSGAGKMLERGEVAHALSPHATRFVFTDLLLLAQSDFMLQTGSMFPEAAASIGFVPPRKRMWVKGCADPAVARAAAGMFDDKLNWYTGLGTPQ